MYLIKNKLTGDEYSIKILSYYIDPVKKEGSILNGTQVIASYNNVLNALSLDLALFRDFNVTHIEEPVTDIKEQDINQADINEPEKLNN